ncbi:SipW-dependent-type signal peptide-containing protein [Paramicrobacterium sp. CJ85]|uniref:SipW-dependent-type signal peptide-containing protein n=1 Tax=Paramicrobacterium sp. CJ85 TaxID=3445355 RepID=UPI003F6049C9
MGRHSSAPSRGWFTKVRAVLAGAVVLGVGGAVTLAAWNDSEFATGTFAASTFGIVGSTNGTQFSEHTQADDAATLAFAVPSGGMSPNTTVYALFSVKTTAASTVGGTVALTATSTNSDGLGGYLTYGVRVINGTTCNTSTFSSGTEVVEPGAPLSANGTATTSVQKAGGNTVNYCFAITMSSSTPNSMQGTSVTPSWKFVATSDS